MNGLMMNFDINECVEKDKIAQEFIEAVNPYRTKPALGLDLRALSKYAKDNKANVPLMTEAELKRFSL